MPRTSALLRSKICFTLILLFATMQAVAQTAQTTGTLKDPDKSLVAGASVTLTNLQTAATLQATTTLSGQYAFSSVAREHTASKPPSPASRPSSSPPSRSPTGRP